MTAADILKGALSLITPPSKWTKESEAQDAAGKFVRPTDDRAKCFCMVGAVQRVAAEEGATAYGEAIRHLRAACGNQSIFEFNDGHGHKAVLTCMRRAIAASEVAA